MTMHVFSTMSIHPSIFNLLSRAELWGQQSKQRDPDILLPGHSLQLLQWDPKVLGVHPATLRRKLILVACVQSLVVLVITQSS